MSVVAEVRLWGTTIGAVSLEEGDDSASFEYAPGFIGSGIQLSPLRMPLSLAASIVFRSCPGARFTVCLVCLPILSPTASATR